jgi:hypothetical protein
MYTYYLRPILIGHEAAPPSGGGHDEGHRWGGRGGAAGVLARLVALPACVAGPRPTRPRAHR